MAKYKAMLAAADMKQSELLQTLIGGGENIDKSMLSKFVNHRCMPTVEQCKAICVALECGVLDLYGIAEVDYTGILTEALPEKKRQSRGGQSHGAGVYNLTVELDRATVAAIFDPENAKKLGIPADKSAFIRIVITSLHNRLQRILAKEKAALGADTPKSGKP